jgi:hypothetical protein
MPTGLATVPTTISKADYKAAFERLGFELNAIRSLVCHPNWVLAEVYEINDDRRPVFKDGKPVFYHRKIPVT